MVMRVLRQSKIWVFLSLLAMLGVVVTPALAFNCCCASLPISTQSNHSQPQTKVMPVAAQPTCHDAQPVLPPENKLCHSAPDARLEDSKPSENDKVASSKNSLSSIKSVCDCPQAEMPPVAVIDGSAFASLGMLAVMPVSQWNVAVPNTQPVRLLVDNTSRPRGPTLSLYPGRAPPAI